MTTLSLVAVASIGVPPGRRVVRDVGPLAESIREIGLLQPIIITKSMGLVAGLHRLEAFRLLGKATIPALVVDFDEVDARLAEIDENLIRNELTVLERGEALKRRKELYEQRHPQTKHGAAGNGRPKSRDTKSVTLPVVAFAEATGSLLGRAPNSIRRDVRIATLLTEETKEKVRGTRLEDNQEVLLKLTAEDPAKQAESAGRILAGQGGHRSEPKLQPAADIGKRRRGVRSPMREKPRIQEVIAALANARSAWRTMTAEWRDSARSDMLFALEAKDGIDRDVSAAISALLRMVEKCEEEAA